MPLYTISKVLFAIFFSLCSPLSFCNWFNCIKRLYILLNYYCFLLHIFFLICVSLLHHLQCTLLSTHWFYSFCPSMLMFEILYYLFITLNEHDNAALLITFLLLVFLFLHFPISKTCSLYYFSWHLNLFYFYQPLTVGSNRNYCF